MPICSAQINSGGSKWEIEPARRVFERAIGLQHDAPEKITIDRSGTNTAAVHDLIEDSDAAIELRQNKYSNNNLAF